MMRKKFEEELNNLNTELISMGSMCEEAINFVIEEMNASDFSDDLYDKVADLEDATDKKEKQIESLCLKLIFSQQPVASDLRFISAILKMISDLERIGDQALDIADLYKEFDSKIALNNTDLKTMALVVSSMVKDSVESFVRKDVAIANSVMKRDNEVDDIFLSIKKQVIDMIADDSNNAEGIVDILMIAKYLERIGDHSVNIAEWVTFAING